LDWIVADLVADAYRRSSLTRNVIDRAGVPAHQVRGVGDLNRLPVTTRREYFADSRLGLRMGTRVDRCHRVRTTGTTGSPLVVYMNRLEFLYRQLQVFRGMRSGVRLTVPLTISSVGVNVPRAQAARSNPLERVGLARVRKIPRSLSSEEQARRLVDQPAQILTGAPSSLELVAEAMQRLDLRLPSPPSVVSPRGEMLRWEARALLAETFGCPVVDQYNCEEIGNIAWECPAETGVYHVNTDACVLETVDDEGAPVPAGVEGRVVVTNLFNRTMPFIRYDLGDRAVFRETPRDRCACGHRGPTLAALLGRLDDFILLSSGERVSPRTIVGCVYRGSQRDVAEPSYFVRRFRVIQDEPNAIRVLVVPAEDAPADLDARIRLECQALESGLRVDVERVGEIPGEPTDKARVVLSNLSDGAS